MPPPSDRPEFWVEDAAEGWDSGARAGGAWAGAESLYGSPTTAWDAPKTTDDGPAGPPEAPPKGPRRWARWAAVGAGLAVIAGIIALQSHGGTAADPSDDAVQDSTPTSAPSAPTSVPSARPAPTTEPAASSSESFEPPASSSDASASLPTTAGVVAENLTDPSLLKDTTWELVGYGQNQVVRYTPATGQIVHTPVPSLNSGGPLSVVVTDDATVIRPYDSVAGYLVRDGGVAEPLTGLLAGGGPVLPGPDAGSVWVMQNVIQDRSDVGTQDAMPPGKLVLVDLDGSPIGPVIDLPDTGGIDLGNPARSDGAGLVLFGWFSGTYLLKPDGPHLLTHGQMLATGPAALLFYDCDDVLRCNGIVVDRATGERRAVPGFTSLPSYLVMGITSLDGRWAAVFSPSAMSMTLVNLETGAMTIPSVNLSPGSESYTGSPAMAFSPDGRYLLIARMTGVEVIDTASGLSVGMLPVPHLTAFATRPLG